MMTHSRLVTVVTSFLGALGLIVAAAGCCSTRRHGDAHVRCCKAFIGPAGEYTCRLIFPPISVNRDETYRFHAANLPAVSISYWTLSGPISERLLGGSDDDVLARTPTSLTVSVLSGDGRRVYEESFELRKLRTFRSEKSWTLALDALGRVVVDMRDYQLEVRVRNGSPRLKDDVRIQGQGGTTHPPR